MSNIRTVDCTGFVSYQARMFCAGSSTFCVQMDVVSVRSDDVKLMYRVATVQDITERLKSQLALRKSEERFCSVVQSVPDAIFIQTNECFSDLNDRALALFGASSPDQMLGSKVIDVTHPDNCEGMDQQTLAQLSPFSLPSRRARGLVWGFPPCMGHRAFSMAALSR